MKKLILLVFLMMSMSLIYAELEVDIPFDLDIVGDDFSVAGSYIYETEWITITNTGNDSLTYTFMYTYENLPTDWYISICDTVNCFQPNWSVPIGLAAGASTQIHIAVTVESTGGFTFDFTFNEGDLTEPLIYNFSFRTADYIVSADDGLVIYDKLFQNYPNPFNPSTTISYTLTPQEIANAGISIYNTKGQLTKTFRNLNSSGSIVWDGTNNNDIIVNSGIYFYKLTGVENSAVKKMILIK